MRQRHVGLMAGVCLLVYLAAVGSEAAYGPGGIGFAEELTWARMSAAYRVTGWADVRALDVTPFGIAAVAGMLTALAAALCGGRVWPTWAISFYAFLLLGSGGWMGFLMLVWLPFAGPLDGEFLDDGCARLTAVGLWTACVLFVLVHRIVPRGEINEAGAECSADEGAVADRAGGA